TARAAPVTDELGRLQGPFNAMLVSPKVGLALQAVGAALRFESGLAGRVRELATLLVAAEARCDYEWLMHEGLARSAGVSDEELASLREGGVPPTLSDDERLARQVVLELARQQRLGDDLLERAHHVFGERGIVELVDLVGYYQLLAMGLQVFRTPLPDGASPPFGEELPARG
ncbi:MAG TPA: carboxymuconolactone decarboxylase family protein, partial [Acidimicrobiales bacterium]|nr:carboxymuconolactone decarboxylase family protein [Acidimicrobiales bacterium]